MKETKNLQGIFSILFLCLFVGNCQSSIQTTQSSTQTNKHRKLVDNYEFTTDEYYDQRTGVLRLFMEDLLKSTNQYDPSIKINTKVGSDNSFTTGNNDSLPSVDKLMPNVNGAVINQNVLEAAKDFQNDLKVMFDTLNPDIFSEDPKIFIGENEAYYLIMQKRGIVFYFMSRIVFYGLLVFLFSKFVSTSFRPFDRKLKTDEITDAKKGWKWTQKCLILFVLGSSIALFGMFDRSGHEIRNSFTDMYFRFRQINANINSIMISNSDINQMNIKLPDNKDARFVIQNQLDTAIISAQSDIEVADRFLSSFTMDQNVTNMIIPFVLFVAGSVMLLLDHLSYKKQGYQTQFAVFLISALALSYVLFALDKYVSGFSGINDFCLSMMRYGTRLAYPFQGLGVNKLLGCSVQNDVFQQLYVNLIAQNAALKIFNNEMYRIGRDKVDSTEAALEVVRILTILESSNPRIDRIGVLLNKNSKVIQDLMSLNGCSSIKGWINDSQKDLCLVASRHVLDGFILLVLLCAVLAVMVWLSYYLFVLAIKLNTRLKVIQYAYKQDSYGNDIDLD